MTTYKQVNIFRHCTRWTR